MKNVLLAVTGLSPQVITETLYALHHSQRQVHTIHVITTRDGKEKILAQLLADGGGHYHRYLREYGIEPSSIDFGPQNVHTITDEHGIEIPDIRDEKDNEYLLKKCLELAFHFTSDRHTAVFFSVAGGRKTMSSCMTLAAQMYGRAQDRLYHVLVSPEFESNRDFFYPPKVSKLIELHDDKGRPLFKETKYAEINLIHIPFVSIRDQLSSELLDAPKDPGTLMLSLIKEEERRLTINLVYGKIIYKTLELDFMPARMALYTFFARQKKNCPKGDVQTCGNCRDCFLGVGQVLNSQDEITEIYRKLSRTRPIDEMSDTGITQLNAENFMSYKGKIKRDILQRFGPYALKELEIASHGSRPNTRYGILMDKERIEILY
ncbi:MAG: TIGR02584 family CRISPR-associated protein [Deltaproteobacteria bacterium]|nr:TIGR02584 family CRISPR-associated protein [Deltaproteobacteria bacterium]MBW1927840.1 TIGR02584 family CRISPR-associated protein [Deltaproteobacteria bacterium]MBW2026223.1 TIGR02584 family CRISPR-associated protein [Deltaproteobacteria bacterium]MBW2127567.1 TIGR02584 family CRISPR-associated protein [Deltaproteobacteria bacterium]